MRSAAPLLLSLAACGGGEPPTPAPDGVEALAPPAFEERVQARIAELAEVVARTPVESGDTPAEGELRGLLDLRLEGTGRMRELPLEEMPRFGDAALPELRALHADETLDDATRVAALELLAEVGTPAAAEVLVDVLETAREPWRRRLAARLLGTSDEDRFLLRMLLHLRYEKDAQTVVWLADALARLGNLAGFAHLDALAAGEAGALARERQAAIVARFEAESARALARTWDTARAHERLQREPSPALRLAAWRELAELSSDRFQLRGVDDARFALSRTGPWGAVLVAEALADADPYVRLHATQVLERMGARARPVVAALHPLLRDERTAHAVAEALGAIAAPASLPLLRASLADRHPHELRVGAAHGLGRYALAHGPDAEHPVCGELAAVVAGPATPPDLALAAAEALLLWADDARAARRLVAGLEDPLGDPQDCEVALERWITRNAAEGVEGFDSLHEAWADLAGPPPLLRTPDDTHQRLAARAALLRSFLQPRP